MPYFGFFNLRPKSTQILYQIMSAYCLATTYNICLNVTTLVTLPGILYNISNNLHCSVWIKQFRVAQSYMGENQLLFIKTSAAQSAFFCTVSSLELMSTRWFLPKFLKSISPNLDTILELSAHKCFVLALSFPSELHIMFNCV